jgi:lysosomal Pro-X carboxypeptidase
MRRILSTGLAMLALALCATESGLEAKRIRSVRNMASFYKRHDAEAVRAKHLAADPLTTVSEYFFDVNVNHFTTNNTNPQTYKMRYLIDESYVKVGDQNPPIFFYCGNEGDVWTFYNNSGFMTKTLPTAFNGVVLLGEHRYSGKSLPFGDNSFTPDNVKYLTVDQTLMDFVKLIEKVKSDNPQYQYSPVFAFGGSYGGMLAAWFRMKYPHVIQGSHASSAPILFFPGSVSPYAFNELVTRSYNNYCPGIKN